MLSSRHKQSEETPLELPPRSSSTLGATPSTPATLSHAALLRSSITPQAGHMMGTALIRLRATPTSGGLSLKPSKLPLQTHTHTHSHRPSGRRFRTRTFPHQVQASRSSIFSDSDIYTPFFQVLKLKVEIPAPPFFCPNPDPSTFSLRTNSEPRLPPD